MKTQIIRLETHDDAISVKDKMDWGQTPRILLVWPPKSRILNRRLDLIFLQRYSRTLGAQLALVCDDTEVKYHAKNLNIPVFTSIRAAEEQYWRKKRFWRRRARANRVKSRKLTPAKPSPKTELIEKRAKIRPHPPNWLTRPSLRLSLFTLGVFSVLAIGALLVPSAEIEIRPKTQIQNITISVAASPKFSQVDLSGAVPARRTSVIVEGRDQIESTGNIYIPDQTARGQVVFTNLTDQEIEIPAGTALYTAGETPISFQTVTAGTAPPNAESRPIAIEAKLAGIMGNVAAAEIIAIEGPLGLVLTVTNPEKTIGGTGRLAPAPIKGDYVRIHEKLLSKLYQTANLELENNLDSADLLLATDPEAYTLIEEVYTPPESQPADNLELKLQIAYEAVIASGIDLKSLAAAVLAANLPEDFVSVPDTIDINHRADTIRHTEKQVEWEMDVGWQIRAVIDPNTAVRMALWNSPEQASAILATNLPLESTPEIRLTPAWWPRLPILPFRVKVIQSP